MNTEINAFLWRAAKRSILTPGQCRVLRQVFPDKATVEDCVSFIEKNRILPESKLAALRLASEVRARHVPVDSLDFDGDIEEVILGKTSVDRAQWKPDMGLEWFCYLAVSKDLLDPGVCAALIADVEEAMDLLGFAQTVTDCGLIKDLAQVQGLVDEALEQWARNKIPPYSVLGTTDLGVGEEGGKVP